ncbi:Na+/H+ antiporter NhaA [Geodermatophilus sabuli]|uniref:Na(+)/H(+) antiporter NhaA n=1 Tax=Geodermatophilus sabuli TaxID=1564158 RepID=A0A285E9Q6_9ACTN|nr:Na+/H+ antiporter NhaA [Geodermatophilus sabuli]MBB3082339.1 Na+/H+ antiporter NhaA [Geodermatophilus sabuli]SNX94791.1 Na+/H+ antiporter NhaA [Geodermatophilus sabuli]
MSAGVVTGAQSSSGGGSGLLARVAPLRRRLRTEAGSAGLLLLATVVALLWANSPVGDSYDAFWHTEFAVRVGGAELVLDLQHWVNDGLMVFFFFVVGLEIKRELVMGELTDRRRAAVPALAAVTGLAVPALVYVLFNLGGPAVSAWGVVISTDTAFLLGVLALVGPACPAQLRLFLLTLAIADDVGALSVIALFYTDDLALGPLALAVSGLALMAGLRYLNVWRGPAYMVLGIAVWIAMYASGVHPTLAGVVIALFTPAYPARVAEVEDAARLTRAYRQSPNPEFARAARLSIDRSVSASERLQQLWQPWTSFVIVPVFALANAGVALTGETLRAALTSPVTLGVIGGLVLGKLLGILLGTLLAVRGGLGELAPGLTGWQLAGGAALSGIGFTISLFIVDLALDDELLADEARVGVLAASLLAALLGWGLFRLADRRRPAGTAGRPVLLDPPVDAGRDHVRGRVDAPLTLVEYGDFECPFCGRATGVVEELRERFGERLRYVFRHVPLVDVHPHARLAAEAAEAAADQGRFWEMHDEMFGAQDRLTPVDLLDHAAAIGLDVQRFARDLGAARHARRVEEDVESAEVSGVEGTPTFFVNGRRHAGPYDADTLAAELLATAEAGADAGDPPSGADDSPSGADGGHGGLVLPALGPRRAEVRPPADADPAPLPADLPETPDRDGADPRLADEHLAVLERFGERRRYAPGDAVFREGDRGYDFAVVLSGAVAMVEDLSRPGQRVLAVHGARRFLGELDLFSDHPVSLTALVLRPAEVLCVPDQRMREVFTADHALKEMVLRSFLLRRSMLLELAADLRIVGRAGSPDSHRLREFARAHRLSAVFVDLDSNADGAEMLGELGVSEADLPVVVWRRGEVLRNPSDAEVAAAAGVDG